MTVAGHADEFVAWVEAVMHPEDAERVLTEVGGLREALGDLLGRLDRLPPEQKALVLGDRAAPPRTLLSTEED